MTEPEATEPETTGPGTQRVLDDTAARGLSVEVVSRPAADGLEAAAALLGVDPSSIVKSLVVKKHGGTFLFALVPGGRQISWPKLRRVVAVNKLSMPPAEVALEATGFERGTISPMGSTTPWPVFADQNIVGKRVVLGAGAQGFSAFVDADALISAYGAEVADITDPETPRD